MSRSATLGNMARDKTVEERREFSSPLSRSRRRKNTIRSFKKRAIDLMTSMQRVLTSEQLERVHGDRAHSHNLTRRGIARAPESQIWDCGPLMEFVWRNDSSDSAGAAMDVSPRSLLAAPTTEHSSGISE